jgi:hypothetical protein
MVKINIIDLLCGEYTFINLSELSILNIFVWLTNK